MPSGSWSDDPVPPSISVESPSKAMNYTYGRDVWLNFTVTVPWTDWYYANTEYPYPEPYATTLGTITEVNYSIDSKPEKTVSKISESPLEVSKIYLPHGGILHFSVNLGRVAVGEHTIVINAKGSAFYGNLTHSAFADNFEYDFQESDELKVAQSSEAINFGVDSSSKQDPSPIPEPQSDSLPTALVVASVIAVAVSVGLLMYFKKRRH